MAQGNAKKIGLDHGDLVGKDDDDHTQYLNDTRHSAAHGSGRWEVNTAVTVPDETFTDVVYDLEKFHDDPNADFDVNTSTGIITFNNAGTYLICAGVRMTNFNTGRMITRIDQNSTLVAYDERSTSTGTGLSPSTTITVVVQASASDTAKVIVYQEQPTPASESVRAEARSFLTVARLQ